MSDRTREGRKARAESGDSDIIDIMLTDYRKACAEQGLSPRGDTVENRVAAAATFLHFRPSMTDGEIEALKTTARRFYRDHPSAVRPTEEDPDVEDPWAQAGWLVLLIENLSRDQA